VTAQRAALALAVEGLDVAYGDFQVLWQAALHVDDGEIVAVLGPNGAGKSTLMNTISGLIVPRAGRITFHGKRIDGLPAHRTAGEGLAHVLERRRLFPFLTVLDNLLLGAHNPTARRHRDDTLARVERCSRSSAPAQASSRTRCRAASSRWSRSRAG
jgi:branched-chain amino acid transport system ATP-binding protein